MLTKDDAPFSRELANPNRFNWRRLLPSPGNLILTILVGVFLAIGQTVGAFSAQPASTAASTSIIPYQGRLADSSGAPLVGSYAMTFRMYNVISGGSALWNETWTGPNNVPVVDGLFSVALGSITPIPQAVFTGNSSLWLGITVGADSEMLPRVQIGSVPFAIQGLTVPNLAITTAKIADGAVTTAKIADGAVTADKLAAGVIGTTQAWIAHSITATSTTSNPFVEMEGMELNVTSTGGQYLILFGAQLLYDAGSSGSIGIQVDGVLQTKARYHQQQVGEYADISFLMTLAPGPHVIRGVWRTDGGTISTDTGNNDDHSLIVLEFN